MSRLMGEEDAICWLTSIANNMPKNVETAPFHQALDEIVGTIKKCGFGQPKTDNPKKVFISQPMRGLSKDEIADNRNKAIEIIQKELGKVEIIDSHFKGDKWQKINKKAPDDKQKRRVFFLGESLKLLAQADCVVFLDGYKEMDGCLCEEFVARQYGIQSYQLIGDELRPVSVLGAMGIDSCQIGSVEVTQ